MSPACVREEGKDMSEVRQEGAVVTIKPGRDVVASMVQDFKGELKAAVEKAPGELVIDLAGVEMVDSVGIGVIIAAHNSLTPIGAKLSVVNVSPDIFDLLRTMRLDRHFTIRPVEGQG